LVNPDWLEGTYVVKNEGLDDEKFEEYNSKKTDIKIYKYRDFASKYPNKISYFQLVLDILEYVPSKLEYIPDVVMIEGKNDFYALKYLKDVILKDKSKINLLPGLASTSLDNLISLYIGWGRNFIILLDSDNSGKKQKDRYTEKFGSLLENRIFTYEDIDVTWKNVAMERIIGEEECLKIQLNSYPESEKFNKKIFNRSIQEMLIKGEEYKFSNITKDKFKKILSF
jgi:5S rRNA maturation endonuclease (ribonuclease M5)